MTQTNPDIDKRLIQTVVLLDRQYLLTKHLIETKQCALQEFEFAISENKQSLNHVLSVYNYIFSLIDHFARYHKIASSLPKLNKKEKEFRALDSTVASFKEIRDQIQHINNDIENDYTGPLLGAIWWVSGNKQFLACFHDIGRQRSSPGLVMDARTGEYVHKFCYVYNEKYYDLDKAIEGMRTFNEHINSWVKISIDGKEYDPKDHFAATAFEIKLGNFSE